MLKYILPSIIFTFFDFFGYNISLKKGWVKDGEISLYRIIQVIVQILIGGLTLYFYGIIPTLIFFILWWTWVDDWLYYIVGVFFGWIFGVTTDWKELLKDDTIYWCWWTAYFLLFKNGWNNRKRKVKKSELIIQSIIGVIISIILVILF